MIGARVGDESSTSPAPLDSSAIATSRRTARPSTAVVGLTRALGCRAGDHRGDGQRGLSRATRRRIWLAHAVAAIVTKTGRTPEQAHGGSCWRRNPQQRLVRPEEVVPTRLPGSVSPAARPSPARRSPSPAGKSHERPGVDCPERQRCHCHPAGRGDVQRVARRLPAPCTVPAWWRSGRRTIIWFQRHTPGDALRRPYPPLSHVVVGPLIRDPALQSSSPPTAP